MLNINLDKEIADKIHSPKINGKPLYARVDGLLESGDSNTEQASDQKWSEATKKYCNSPGNVKRIFITNKRVIVHFHKPPRFTRNKSSLVMEKTIDHDFNYIRESIMQGTNEYRVTKTGLRAIFRPWVCSNIEEIYFDWTMFLSEDTLNFGYGDWFQMYAPGKSQGLYDSTPIKNLFLDACGTDLKDISSRYPRLRVVGYLQDLEDIYSHNKLKPGVDYIEDMQKMWVENPVVKEYVTNGSVVSLYKLESTPKLNTKHSVKEGIYVYDREVLKGHFINLESRIKDFARGIRDKELDSQKDELIQKVDSAKTSLEIAVDEVYSACGAEMAKYTLKIAFRGIPVAEQNKLLEEMSSEGRERYKKLLNR